MNIEEGEGKPILLVEVIEDPADKAMPHKLKLNKDAMKLLMPSSERYVDLNHLGSSSYYLRAVSVR